MDENLFRLDEIRHAIERLEPSTYLTVPYFEKWLLAMQSVLVSKGHLDPAVLESTS